MFPLARAIVNGMAGLALLVSGAVVGCTYSPQVISHVTGYETTTSWDHKTATVTEGVARFSFDYPLRYGIDPTGGFWKDEGFTTMDLTSPQEGMQGSQLLIRVYVEKSDNASWLTDPESDLARLRQLHFDLLLLERSPIEVAGLRGEQILYSYSRPLDRQGFKWLTLKAREIFFSNGNLRWQIHLSYYVTTSELAEGYERDLRQVLTTLRIEG